MLESEVSPEERIFKGWKETKSVDYIFKRVDSARPEAPSFLGKF